MILLQVRCRSGGMTAAMGRNGPQWFTFWVAGVALALATLALFLTVVQAVEGALQVYLAFRNAS